MQVARQQGISTTGRRRLLCKVLLINKRLKINVIEKLVSQIRLLRSVSLQSLCRMHNRFVAALALM
eukprot:422476-Pelagomonas_calceolata.AAC.1